MRTTIPWHTVRAELAQRKPIGTPRPAADFWSDFRARLPAHAPEAAPARRVASAHVWQWSAVGVCAGLALTAGYLGLTRTATARSTIRSYQIDVPHAAVMLLSDQAGEATILWVAGMQCD